MRKFYSHTLSLALLALSLVPSFGASKPWQTLTNCTLVANEYNDGDSFHVSYSGKEYIFRLYFVDAPEIDNQFPDRVAAQAAYFGITAEQAIQIGRDAAKFTADHLARTFTITTRWQNAAGRSTLGREYGIVAFSGGQLDELLVSNGLVRIHGVDVGGLGKERVDRLRKIEDQAKARNVGAWALAKRP